MAVELRDDYPVADGEVRLAVSIGEGQTGLVSVFLGGMKISRTPAPIDVRVGKGSDILRQAPRSAHHVNDVNSQTNKMSSRRSSGSISVLVGSRSWMSADPEQREDVRASARQTREFWALRIVP